MLVLSHKLSLVTLDLVNRNIWFSEGLTSAQNVPPGTPLIQVLL